jgi:hypothetical protein
MQIERKDTFAAVLRGQELLIGGALSALRTLCAAAACESAAANEC